MIKIVLTTAMVFLAGCGGPEGLNPAEGTYAPRLTSSEEDRRGAEDARRALRDRRAREAAEAQMRSQASCPNPALPTAEETRRGQLPRLHYNSPEEYRVRRPDGRVLYVPQLPECQAGAPSSRWVCLRSLSHRREVMGKGDEVYVSTTVWGLRCLP